ncbi:unnamed protein product [Owenia fusiformis]|uniref:Uncharacterized protein n=1 Tax=Owenia fusiformis TaxID=6347 RepID=A0A8J1TW71_OWEFU|nr:unnamed protein product [Owenia fusiformis]
MAENGVVSNTESITETINNDLFTCLACKKDLASPCTLPCLHTFCDACIIKPTNNDVVKATTCPTCGEKTKLHEDTPKTLSNFVSELQEYQKSNAKLEKCCSLCTDEKPADFKCFDCMDFLCGECAEMHGKIKVAKDHKVLNIDSLTSNDVGELYRAQPKPCNIHQGEFLKFFCRPCSKVICRDCKLIEHEGHKCVNIADQAGQDKQLLSTAMENMNPVIQGIKTNISELTKNEQELSDRCNIVRDDMKTRRDNLHKIIDECYENMNAEMVTMYNTNQKKIDSYKDVFETMSKSHSATFQFVQTFLKYGKDADIIDEKSNVTVRLNALRDEKTPVIQLDNFKEWGFIKGDSNETDLKVLFGQIKTPPKQDDSSSNSKETHSGSNKSEGLTDAERKSSTVSTGLDGTEGRFISYIGTISSTASIIKGQLVSWFNSKSSNDSARGNISGISKAPLGLLAVIDHNNRKVKFYDNGKLKSEFSGSGKHRLQGPWDVVVLSNTNMAISDRTSKSIKIFSPQGKFVTSIGKYLKEPCGITVNSKGQLLVADYANKCVYIHNENGSVLHTVLNLNNNWPIYICVNQSDDIIVSDFKAHCIKVLNSHGRVKHIYGTIGPDQGLLNGPLGVCTDSHGHIIVADYNNHAVHLLTPDARFKCYLLTREDGIESPRAVAIDGNGHLVVTELSGMVKIFKYIE